MSESTQLEHHQQMESINGIVDPSSIQENINDHYDHNNNINDQQHFDNNNEQHMHDMANGVGAGDDFPQSLENIISQEQALALQHIHAFHQSMPLITPPNFPRPTVKRRKPVKWEQWEEKNLIEE